ncbi:MAG: plastoquinol terminal oxidase, partial [Leptolyngbyaceae cyanobacterium RM2_2_4]|nr:plastoquinol terminal oxidase [Leptolyngbyaceae cyanobacterium RM2_2_4]
MKALIQSIVSILVFITDRVYRNRPYPRFYVLETVARVPYFAYLSVLHLYETLGWWRKADL